MMTIMEGEKKHLPPTPLTEVKGVGSLMKTAKTVAYVYAFMAALILFTGFLAVSPNINTSLFSPHSTSPFSSIFSYVFPDANCSSSAKLGDQTGAHASLPSLRSDSSFLAGGAFSKRERNASSPLQHTVDDFRNGTIPIGVGGSVSVSPSPPDGLANSSQPPPSPFLVTSSQPDGDGRNISTIGDGAVVFQGGIVASSGIKNVSRETRSNRNTTSPGFLVKTLPGNESISGNSTKNLVGRKPSTNSSARAVDHDRKKWSECDIFDGKWVRDNRYPLFPAGSCPFIDESFDCFLNGRPERIYEKWRWQPNGCNIPRLDPKDMLKRLRGKRLVFIGDSLNRNMWESLICILWNSVNNKTRVVEVSGRHEFRTEGSYVFKFLDYKASVEFFRSTFLVEELESRQPDGRTKETLRLDIIDRSSSKYKNADVLVFNTGHWWTHEKTSTGKDYYQEGNHVYPELDVNEAFKKALTTWTKWLDSNINPKKTLVFFRGYSDSHFSGGQWNSGGACDNETEPIMKDEHLKPYPIKMKALESVIGEARTPISYLNITRMTDYRKDAHPSIYRKRNLTEEERRSPERFQDCSHWCLPGVPDVWNELLYAKLIMMGR